MARDVARVNPADAARADEREIETCHLCHFFPLPSISSA
jgi:hypothetical protein